MPLLEPGSQRAKLAIVVGSHRPGSQSIKVGRFVEVTIHSVLAGTDVFLLDLAANPLPLWDEDFWDGAERWQAVWGPIADELRAADGLVFITPEWGGMAPAALKNFLLLAGNDEIGHKPALIVAVSHSRGGAYPVAELRASSHKNNHVCYIPEQVIVRDARNVLNDAEPASRDDEMIRARIVYTLRVLGAYADALRAVRRSGVIDHETFPYGM
jgi:NAD(P)H-dependent FMN reductase